MKYIKYIIIAFFSFFVFSANAQEMVTENQVAEEIFACFEEINASNFEAVMDAITFSEIQLLEAQGYQVNQNDYPLFCGRVNSLQAGR